MFNFSKRCKLTAETTEPIKVDTLITNEPKEEWVWVDGYKGTDKDMKAYGDFQYELGKEYSTEDHVLLCNNGFHLCMTIVHTLRYYSWLYRGNNRYFKVKALVKKSDVAKYGTWIKGNYFDDHIDKLVAKKIILTEEITGTELLLEAIKRKDSSIQINTLDEFKEASQIGYKKWYTNHLRNQLQGKYSELFIEILFDNIKLDELEARTKEALAYIEEGVSKDVAVYLLMRKM